MGLAATARPELFAAFPLLAAHAAWTKRRGRLGWATLGFVAVAAAYVALNLWTSGRPLPFTFYAKTEGQSLFDVLASGAIRPIGHALAIQPWQFLDTSWRWYVDQSALLFAVGLAGVVALLDAPAGGAVLLLLVGLPAIIGAVRPEPPLLLQQGRYVAHLLVLFFVTAAAGLAWLKARTRHGWVVLAVAVLALARLGAQDVKFADEHGRMVQNITQLEVAAGQWVAANTPPDALIATNDIGAIGWFSRRRILDTEGLITPEIVPYKRRGDMLGFLEQARPDLLIVFPEWYPDLVARTDLFREIDRIEVPVAVSSANRALVVYRTPWTRFR